MKNLSRLICITQLVLLLVSLSCGSDSGPLGPSATVVPVGSAAQLVGRWGQASLFAGGLPLSAYTVPAFAAGKFDARLVSGSADLEFTRTGEMSGLFSVLAAGVSADTLDPLHTVPGQFDYWGDFSLGAAGALTVTLRTGGSKNKTFSGTASLLADTLIVNFTLASPPQKTVGFLPDTTAFIARLVKQ